MGLFVLIEMAKGKADPDDGSKGCVKWLEGGYMTASKHLKAVHDDDLEAFLRSLGMLGNINAGKVRCSVCGTLITTENLGALYPSSGAIKVLCDLPSCILAFTHARNEMSHG